jgi:hypothetical protein
MQASWPPTGEKSDETFAPQDDRPACHGRRGVLAFAAYPALGDPVNGHNATPGTLTCGITHPTTSGSGAALAIQLTDGSGVFVVKEVPDFGIAVGGGVPEGNLQTCVLVEPSLGNVPITVIGILTSTG